MESSVFVKNKNTAKLNQLFHDLNETNKAYCTSQSEHIKPRLKQKIINMIYEICKLYDVQIDCKICGKGHVQNIEPQILHECANILIIVFVGYSDCCGYRQIIPFANIRCLGKCQSCEKCAMKNYVNGLNL